MALEDKVLRDHLTKLLLGAEAHASIASALSDFPVKRAGEKPGGLPYSAWQLLEHMRMAIDDLLEYVTNSEYEAPQWPDDYWPKEAAPPSPEAWEKSVAALHAGLQELAELAADENSNLYDTIPWAENGHTLLRELLVAADHTSYHTGELIVVRRLLGEWKG
jgi:hypothetical protein